MPDDEQEIDEARAFFRSHGLLPPIPEQYGEDEERAEQLRQQILTRRETRPGVARRRTLLAAAAVAAIAIGGGVYGLTRSTPATAAESPTMLTYSAANPDAVGSAPPATGVLEAAARSAAGSSAPSGTGAVQYVSRYGWLPSVQVDAPAAPVDARIYPTVTQWWLAPDGAVRVDEHRGAPLGIDGRVGDDVPERTGETTSETNPAGTIDPDLARRLSTDPTTLRAELLDMQAGMPCSTDARWQAECLVRAIQTLEDQYVVGPQLTAAMWRVLADETAIRSLGSTTDRLGRPASAVALPPEVGQPFEAVVVLLISPSTGAYLGTETVTLHDAVLGIDEPAVTAFTALSTAQRVSSPGDTP